MRRPRVTTVVRGRSTPTRDAYAPATTSQQSRSGSLAATCRSRPAASSISVAPPLWCSATPPAGRAARSPRGPHPQRPDDQLQSERRHGLLGGRADRIAQVPGSVAVAAALEEARVVRQQHDRPGRLPVADQLPHQLRPEMVHRPPADGEPARVGRLGVPHRGGDFAPATGQVRRPGPKTQAVASCSKSTAPGPCRPRQTCAGSGNKSGEQACRENLLTRHPAGWGGAARRGTAAFPRPCRMRIMLASCGSVARHRGRAPPPSRPPNRPLAPG